MTEKRFKQIMMFLVMCLFMFFASGVIIQGMPRKKITFVPVQFTNEVEDVTISPVKFKKIKSIEKPNNPYILKPFYRK
jgi:hypothetical protein